MCLFSAGFIIVYCVVEPLINEKPIVILLLTRPLLLLLLLLLLLPPPPQHVAAGNVRQPKKRISIPTRRGKEISLLLSIQKGSQVQTTPYSLCTRGSLRAVKRPQRKPDH